MSDYTSDTLIALNQIVGETGAVLNKDSLLSVFASVDYYEDPLAKIASIGRSIMQNHPFVDGNKRTGIVFMISALSDSFHKSDDAVLDFAVMSVIEQWDVDQIVAWLK